MMRSVLLAVAALVATAGAAIGADLPASAENGPIQGGFQAEFGTRMWLGFGSTSKNLYDPGGASLTSRLTYGNLTTVSGELFGKVTADEFFVSGFAGLGMVSAGNLQDEDFPPDTVPYSSTNSSQRDGSLNYATIDLGRYFYESPDAKLGAFIGYNYFNQQVNAFGCAQTASNPGICVPSLSDSIRTISQDNTWQSVRLGLNGQVKLSDRWTLSGDGAVLPYVSLSGTDTHWLRIPSSFTGPIPEDGTGWGVQAQAMLDYQVSDKLSVGIGGRYWHMQTAGSAHFENHLSGGGGVPQPLTWSTDVGGLLAEAKATF